MAPQIDGRKVDKVGESSKARPAPSDDAGDIEAIQSFSGGDAVTQPRPADPADPSRHPPTEVVPPSDPPASAGEVQATQILTDPQTVPRPRPADPAGPPRRPPTEVVPPSDPPGGAGEVQATQTFSGGDAVTRSRSADPAGPPRRPSAEVVRRGPPDEVVRYGPGVPAVLPDAHAGQTAERVWRGRLPASPGPARLGGWAGCSAQRSP